MAANFIPSPTLVAQIAVDPQIGATMMALGEEGLAIGQRLAPVGETRKLKPSMKVGPIPGNGARISVNVEYWFFPEYGIHQRPQPYMRPIITALGLKPSGPQDTGL